jgi:uncharacterized protein
MVKKLLKRFMPKKHHVTEHKALQIFGDTLHNPNLWHLNRHSVGRAFFIGLFCAWIPAPFQMVIAAAGAILFHANLALSVALVWITNPITMAPMFYFAYKIGNMILSGPDIPFEFQLSINWLLSTVNDIWQPLFLGCFLLGISSAILGYITTKLLWRYLAIKNWQERKAKRLLKKAQKRAKKNSH